MTKAKASSLAAIIVASMLANVSVPPAWSEDYGGCPSCTCLLEYGRYTFADLPEQSAWSPLLLQACNFARLDDNADYAASRTLLRRFSGYYRRAIEDPQEQAACEAAWQEEVAALAEAPAAACLLMPGPAEGAREGREDDLLRRCSADATLSLNVMKPIPESAACPWLGHMRRVLGTVNRIETVAFIRRAGLIDDMEDMAQRDPRLVQAIWYSALHADQDQIFQKLVLAQLEGLLAKNLVEPEPVARLKDDIAIHEEGVQYFGFSFRCENGKAVHHPPLKDPAMIDEWRRDYGLQPLASLEADQAKRCAAPH